MDNIYARIDADIKNRLSEHRYYHSFCVAKAAKELAEKYGADPVKAEIGGIGHDVFKELSREDSFAFFDANGITLCAIEKSAPKLWHAISGSVYLKNEYGLDDDIVSAVRYHTTGKKDMTLLEKVLYTADFISEDRNYPGVDKMREMAESSLEDAMREGLRFTVFELSEKGVPIHPDTFEAYNEITLRSDNK